MATALLLAGCPTEPRRPSEAAPPPVTGVHEGRPFEVIPQESLITVAVFRGGALARAGHNHVVASRDVSGTIYVADNLARSSFDIRFPVAKLTVDEPELRAQEGADFPPEVPESAKEGTRKNMLSPALLDGERFPEIRLQSAGALERIAGGWRAQVMVTVRDQTRTVAIPVRVEVKADEVLASGETSLKQTDLGLTPFSALLGALQVQDEMKVRFRILARERRN